jgi:hypothetical protein
MKGWKKRCFESGSFPFRKILGEWASLVKMGPPTGNA